MNRATRYDAIIATLVGVLALVVSAYTAHVQRQQVRAQVYPIVSLTHGFSDKEVHVDLANKGSGPAMIRNVLMSIDGKPIHNWIELVTRAVGEGPAASLSYSSFGRSVVAAGEQIRVLSFACVPAAAPKPATNEPARTKGFVPPTPTDGPCARLMTLLRDASLSICYCSTLDDCSLYEDGPGQEPTTTETRRCRAPSDDSFN